MIFLARIAAGKQGNRNIQLQDMLVALVCEDQNLIDEMLLGAGDPRLVGPWELQPSSALLPSSVASDLLSILQRDVSSGPPLPPETDLPLSSQSKVLLQRASEIAKGGESEQVEPRHLWRAILSMEQNQYTSFLKSHGITASSF